MVPGGIRAIATQRAVGSPPEIEDVTTRVDVSFVARGSAREGLHAEQQVLKRCLGAGSTPCSSFSRQIRKVRGAKGYPGPVTGLLAQPGRWEGPTPFHFFNVFMEVGGIRGPALPLRPRAA
jgi:hypothetical protein